MSSADSQRGAALGEVAPPQAAMVEEAKVSQAKSVFEYMSEKDRERLAAFAAAAKGLSAPPPALAKDEAPEQPQAPAEEIEIPPLSPRTASSALRGFVPYGDDPAKQDRYRSYLSSQTYNTTTPMPNLRTGTVEEINKELQDFAASARIFKPMSFAMSNRFTAGSSSLAATDLKQPKAGLHLYDAEKAKADMEKPKGETVAEMKHKNPREEAAAKGMYGPLTRETKTFYPEKLLCRRFGVQNPYPDGDPSKGDKAAGGGEAGAIGDLPVNDASWQDSFIHKELEVPATTPTAPTEDARPKSIAEVGMAEDSTQGRDTLTYVKPSLDIFKAIFEAGSDSEDEEEIPGPAATATAVNRIGEDPFPVKQETPVDLATFRPVFQNRKEGEGDGDKAEKKKSKKDKKKRKGVLSFEVDPEEEVAEKEFKKKKRNLAQTALDIKAKVVKEANVEPADVVEEEWVEKPVSYAKMGARKGAADFM
jgi:G patch domain-containing protein 1